MTYISLYKSKLVFNSNNVIDTKGNSSRDFTLAKSSGVGYKEISLYPYITLVNVNTNQRQQEQE